MTAEKKGERLGGKTSQALSMTAGEKVEADPSPIRAGRVWAQDDSGKEKPANRDIGVPGKSLRYQTISRTAAAM
jgi:hypothetical protein